MAIIYSYPEIPDVQGGDLLLISDTGAPNKPTRSVDIDDLAAYIGTVVGVVQNLQSVLTVGNTYVSADGYGTFTLNDIANNDGSITFVNPNEGWGYQISAEEGFNITNGSGTNLMSIYSSGLSIRDGVQIMNIGTNALTATRNVYFPDASGTIALTSDIPSPGPSGSGTTNYTARWTNANTLGIGTLYDNGTNVGIGTTTPTQKLEVNGTMLLSTLPNNNGRLCLGSVSTNLFSNAASGHLYISTNGSTRMTILDNGKVGIGTTSPSQKLHIEASDPRIRIVDTDGTNWQSEVFTQGGALKLQARNGTNFGNISFQGDNGTTESEYARFNSVGNFGIGTNSPSEKLDVRGNVYIETLTPSITLNRNFSGLQEYSIINNGNFTIEKTTLDSGGSFIIKDENGKTPLNISMGLLNPDIIVSGDLIVKNKTGTTTNLYVQENNGNVGIGTTSPSQKLEVAGNIQVNGSNDSADGLHLKDRTFIAFSDASSVVSRFRSSAAGVFQFQDGSYNTNMVLNTNGNSYLNGGNVGIGTTSPGAKLDVNGTTYLRSVALDSVFGYSGNNIQFTNSGNTTFNNSNVGIGTTSPLSKLNVNGSIKIEGENQLYFGSSGSVPLWEIKASGSDLVINDTGSNVGSVLFNNDEGIVLPRLTTTEINAIS